MTSSSVETRVLEAWSKLHNYAVNFDFEVGVQPLSNWQAPAVRRARAQECLVVSGPLCTRPRGLTAPPRRCHVA
jgi:hypothetical protein